MQKVVIDTNVLVSSLIQRSFPYKIVNELFIEGKIKLYVSEVLMKKYYDVLRRPKFAAYHDFVARADSLFADVCMADYIITGSTNDFTFPTYKYTQIVTPKDY